jgi:anaerobic selenocysteine-containing dehydrogenase
MPAVDPALSPTACILCSQNCGLRVQVTPEGRLTRIRGDREHPISQGYACEKAQRLDHYQNGPGRLTTPLRRRDDGTFEAVDWNTAIAEIAGRLGAIRDTHGGASIFYYGGGGQGNHLGGGYGRATRAALGSKYASNALAQEKTGEFWVDGQLFGKPRCHTAPDFEHAEVAVFVGKNPWQSHGFPRARVVLKALAADPARTLIVIDPRRTETADLADIHLQVRPGTDAFVLAAMLGVIVQENLVDHAFLAEHTTGFEAVRAAVADVDVAACAHRAGVSEALLRTAARRIATAKSVSMLEDLGIQQAPHSTLNSYLEKLVYLVTGHFGRPGCMNLHSRFVSLVGGGNPNAASPVGGHRIIGGMVPCNVIPDEILTDHPQRFRAMLVESANPAHSLADGPRMREALRALECLVVIDVALTETARLAHYVLPAASQFEKWEMTFFNLEYPRNGLHLRAPLVPAREGTLPEAEIHRRLTRALGGYTDADVAPLHAAAALVPAQGRGPYAMTFMGQVAMNPRLMPLAPVLLYETLGPTLGEAAEAAIVWGLAQTCAMTSPEPVRRAGIAGEGPALGDALFEAILRHPSGLIFTVDDPETATWQRVETRDGRVHLDIAELLPELAGLAAELETPADPEFPFVLAAGERRSSTANTIFRDDGWRTTDRQGALRMCPDDAAVLGLTDGGRARITTARGSAVAIVEVTPTLRPGHVTLPNGLGLDGPPGGGAGAGVAPNELTSGADRDWLAGTPHHKHVRARVEAVT